MERGAWLLRLLLAWGLLAGPRAQQPNPSARVRGDFVIGALFSVHHQPGRGSQNALVCGAIRELYGIQRVETALWTLDQINNSSEVLRGVTLGLEARDSCWFAPVALQQSIELVRDAITPAVVKPISTEPLDGASDSCLVDPPLDREKKAPLIGVVGPGSSSVALQVQNLLQLFSIPQIGYSCTSRDLSDKSRYSTFLRVVPSDYYQAQLLVDLVRYFNWTYVSIVNTDGIVTLAVSNSIDNNSSSISIDAKTLVNEKDFPYIVSVTKKDIQSYSRHVCSGTIINKKWVVTAARCVLEGPEKYEIRYGERSASFWEPTGTTNVPVKETHIHEGFDTKENRVYAPNDIALLLLADEIKLDDKVKIITLPASSKKYVTNKKYKMMGFNFKYSEPQFLLKSFDVMALDEMFCNETLIVHKNARLYPSQFCVIDPTKLLQPVYTIDGDSGNPLVEYDGENPTLLGIASAVSTQIVTGTSVFTHIPPYVKWINEKTGNGAFDLKYCPYLFIIVAVSAISNISS